MSAPESPLHDIVQTWLTTFQSVLTAGDVDAAVDMFHDTGYWRDLLCFTWAIRSLNGTQEIRAFLRARGDERALQNTAIDVDTLRRFSVLPGMPASPEDGVLAAFNFSVTSPSATGRGLVRLLKSSDGKWAAATLLTKLEDFVGYEEKTGYIAAPGVDTLSGPTPTEHVILKEAAIVQDLDVLIVGAGQSGLMLAARLWQNGLNALVIDKFPRVGDSWRQRYPTLALHTPSRMSSFLYQEYPTTSPSFLPAGRLADFMEYYAASQEICVWCSATLEGRPHFDDVSQKWTVRVIHQGETRELLPVHLVMATGATGKPSVPTVPGIDHFRGKWYHSSQHQGAQAWKDKRVIVVGAGNTGADLCQEFVHYGATSVLMVQRSSTAVMRRTTAKAFLFDSSYPDGKSVAAADFEGESMSLGYQNNMAASGFTAFLKQVDEDMLSGLERAGFRTNQGEDLGKGEIGVFGVLSQRYRGIYLDVGCAQLIIDGIVRVKQGVTVQEATEDGLVFSDGSQEDADLIVFATGYESANESMVDILGEELASKIGQIWGTDDEGELQGCYTPHEQPNLWMAMGAMVQSRTGSKYLALQILAQKHKLVNSPRRAASEQCSQ
ncbi:FAD/NAD(P)-binding domain-containing protein [Exidia glandulosa HHB12029]|uniref:FAD/NAD(P)-binding domain-containing protein n=1 Tax=Exidia glandulosa HHB12029 TaxID=1314781 RepID=A0A165J0Q8_EXIGL|nr:FAD/NAD(P)-binding domain-containing protein [Exidia glandulosa HHB12029]KZV94155.1 FAD/NAD(P)-binding domain-containing protein [Exidia glandulosa HHB12029]